VRVVSLIILKIPFIFNCKIIKRLVIKARMLRLSVQLPSCNAHNFYKVYIELAKSTCSLV